MAAFFLSLISHHQPHHDTCTCSGTCEVHDGQQDDGQQDNGLAVVSYCAILSIFTKFTRLEQIEKCQRVKSVKGMELFVNLEGLSHKTFDYVAFLLLQGLAKE